jgi:hypothetical protein
MNKILAILTIAIIGFSTVSMINATRIDIDADWRLVTNFKIFDITTNDLIWDRDVAAGDAHDKTFDGESHKFHQIAITVTPYGGTNPGSICIVNNVYDGKNIKINSNLKFKVWHYYKFWLDGHIGNNKNI